MQDNEPNESLTPVGIGKRKLAVGTLLFVGLTIAVFVYQLTRIDSTDVGPTLGGLRWPFALLILVALPLEPIATSARIWVVCRVLHPGVSFWSCFKADFANMGLAMLTPSQTGGGVAQIYMLRRDGLRLSTALTVSLLSFLGTLVGLVCMGLYSILIGDAGESAGALFSVAVWTVTVSAGVMLVGAVVPGVLRVPIAAMSRALAAVTGRADRLCEWRRPDGGVDDPPRDVMGPFAATCVNVVYGYRHDALRFLRGGKRAFVAVVVLTIVFLFARCLMSYLAVRFLGVEVGFTRVIEIQAALIFIVYFAPTPGSAGVAEAASLVAMQGIITPGFAPYYNVLWRFTTGYLQAFAGLVLLARAVAHDAREAIRTRSRS